MRIEATSLPTAEQKPPKLRWYQWRLRSLFLLTLLVATGMSWLTVTIQNQWKQKAAAEAIVKAGGTVESETTWLGKLLRDDSLVSVTEVSFYHYGGTATDAVLVHLERLNHLQSLDVGATDVTDGGLVHVRGLSNLKSLGLGWEVTDAGLLYLKGLSQLKWLGLHKTQVSDAGLVHLQGLSQLQYLFLPDTQVTDAGIVHLQGLNQLVELDLRNTKVTAQGAKKLQQALPKCKIAR